MMIRNWSDFKYELSELLLGKQLDEAYKQGITIGAEYAARKLSFEVSLQRGLELTKTEQRGYDYAIEAVARVKPEISLQTGAML
jgi:NOL1/NOP2/fmu family ribosome biogenesis protein